MLFIYGHTQSKFDNNYACEHRETANGTEEKEMEPKSEEATETNCEEAQQEN